MLFDKSGRADVYVRICGEENNNMEQRELAALPVMKHQPMQTLGKKKHRMTTANGVWIPIGAMTRPHEKLDRGTLWSKDLARISRMHVCDRPRFAYSYGSNKANHSCPNQT